MAPPSFNDLDKSCRDLFNRGYNFGFLKIDSSAKSGRNGELEFKSAASHNLKSQATTGSVDIKYKIPAYGIVITESWKTNNTLGTTVDIKDQFLRGSKLTFDTTYSPNFGRRDMKLKADWANPIFNISADVSFNGDPDATLAVVMTQGQWLLGVKGGFTLGAQRKSGSVTLGHAGADYIITTHFTSDNKVGCKIFHRAVKNVDLGYQLGWAVGTDSTDFGVAAKYVTPSNLVFRAKLDNKSNIGVSACQALSKDLKVTASTQFTFASEEAPKFGIGFEYSP